MSCSAWRSIVAVSLALVFVTDLNATWHELVKRLNDLSEDASMITPLSRSMV